jgi:hypothetical protein
MNYDGLFTKPAGIIYDCFDPIRHKVPRFAIPGNWPRWLGLDFGGVHTVGVFVAEELGPQNELTGRLFVYRVYGPAGNATAKQHVTAILKGEPCIPDAVGGSKSEHQWRDEFGAAGLGVREPPISDVEVGIDRVYGAIKQNQLLVLDDPDSGTQSLLDELASYSRVLDEMGEPTRDIDEKSSFHCADALRYVIAYLKDGGAIWPASTEVPREYQSEILNAPEGVFLEHPREEFKKWRRNWT